MTTFTPSPCRHCRYWERREGGEDCAKGLLMRKHQCAGYEREVGSDDDWEPEESAMSDEPVHNRKINK